MNTLKSLLLAMTLGWAIGLTGCAHGDAERAGERIDDAMGTAGDRIEDAAEETGEAIEDAADEVEDELD
ncbi:MAG: hypothetical protein AB1813_06640 [Verrucomicrobiota bacterium]